MDKQIGKLQRWLILFNVSLSVFMATLDGSIVNIALPVISKHLSVSISSIQWVVTSYLLTISVLLLIWGKLSDMYGRKRVFAFGFLIFTVGSGLCGLSGSLEMLVLSRVVQAVGASSMMALSQGIVTSTFPPAERGRALGITGTTVAIGSLVGPSLGGVLVHLAGWQSIFFINIPIGILGTALTFVIIPHMETKPEPGRFDFRGAVLLAASISMLFLGLLFLQDGVISLAAFVPVFLLAAAVLVFFIRYELKIPNPLLNLNLFRNHIFSMGILSAYLSFVAMFCITLFMPFFLQYVLKLDILGAGLLMSFYPATTAIVAPISGWLSDKISYRPLTVAGLMISTITMFVLSTTHPTVNHTEIAVLMVLMGMGAAIFQSPNNSSVMGAVPREQLGVAGGINALFRNLGMVSGATLSVILFTFTAKMNINNFTNAGAAFDTTAFMKGFRVVILFAAFVSLIAAAVTTRRSLGKFFERKETGGKPGTPPEKE
jgi:EmrB/QacA subfamily drug resistance transporter